MIFLLLEKLESLQKKYSEKVGKRKELQSTMKAQKWTSGVSVSRFDIRYYRLLIISIGQWVLSVFSPMFFLCLNHPVVTSTLHISGLIVSHSRKLLAHGQHKSTLWIDIQNSDSHALLRSNISGLRRYFLRPETLDLLIWKKIGSCTHPFSNA